MCNSTYDEKRLYKLKSISTIMGLKKSKTFFTLQNEIKSVNTDVIDYNINIQKIENDFFTHIEKHKTMKIFIEGEHVFKVLVPREQKLTSYYNHDIKTVIIEKKNSISPLKVSERNAYTTYYNSGPGNKVWYILPPTETSFVNTLFKIFICDRKNCENVSIHSTIVPTLNFLNHYKIKYNRVIQFPQEMVVFYPFVYHFGFVTDHVLMDTTNFYQAELVPILKYEYIKNTAYIQNGTMCSICLHNERIQFSQILSLDVFCVTCQLIRQRALTFDNKYGDNDNGNTRKKIS